jgi:hypothetical protein
MKAGKASVTGRVGVDSSANTIALEGYAALPVTLKDVKLRFENGKSCSGKSKGGNLKLDEP